MKLPATLSILSLLLLLLPSPSTANENNFLVTGETLHADERLTYAGSMFVMQGDCNLVLYSKTPGHGFQSNTANRGKDCRLTLNDYGQLVITSGSGSMVWSSPRKPTQGDYAAVLGPDGVLNIFGPSIFSIPERASTSESSALGYQLKNIPLVSNLMFSSQVLYGEASLTNRDYKLALTESCNLEFSKASTGVVWESNTNGRGQYCFLRLNQVGELSIINDNYVVLWSSPRRLGTPEGKYVLIVGIHGQAVIYGPVVWSAGTPAVGYLAQFRGAAR